MSWLLFGQIAALMFFGCALAIVVKQAKGNK